MRSHQPKHIANNRSVSGIWLKLMLVELLAVLSVALPQMFSAHAGASPRAPQGFLFTVTTLDDHNDFVCDGTDCTLREAIQAANNAATEDTIDFAVTGVINLASALPDISDRVTIDGPGADMLTVRPDVGPEFRIFNVTTSGTVTFSGLTITLGESNDMGAGIQNAGTGTVNVINSTVSANEADSGGGIANASSGTVNITNSTISDNFGSIDCGGILNNGTGTVNVTDSNVSDNFAGRYGGGIYNVNGTVRITNSTISDNRGGECGGGITNRGIVTITDSTISDNRGGDGGGLCSFGFPPGQGTVIVINSTITHNTVTDQGGGGIYNENRTGAVNITNSTISHNIASDSRGGGIHNRSGTLNVTNSTLVGNDGSAGGGLYNQSGTLNITNSTISDNRTSAPSFGSAASDGYGGGIFNDDCCGTVNLTNSTVARNSATGTSSNGKGGGIANVNTADPTGTPGTFNVKSSIIALNTANTDGPDAVGPFTSAGFNLVGRADSSTVGFTQPTDLTGTVASPRDPGLDPSGLQDNGGATLTIALVCGSAAIDKGTSMGLTGQLTIDQRGTGFPRIVDDVFIPNANDIQGDGTDIGAFELSICNHPPVAQCRNIQVSVNANCQATITAAQIDNGSFDPDPGDSIASRSLDNSGPFGLGQHTVTLTVTDTHGAMSSCMATVTVVDTTPPTITCPANIIIKTTNPGNSTVVVNYPPPSASDNCPGVMVACSPPSGSQFPLGATTVNCTATDAATNNATCSFVVTVFDVCVQDDTRRDTLLFNSQTGDYLFVKCGAGGFSLSGRGIVRVQGSIFTLEHNASDRRVTAKLDNSVKRGSASVQYFPQGMTYTITDRNTSDNTCACP